jgi:hypothetical protein
MMCAIRWQAIRQPGGDPVCLVIAPAHRSSQSEVGSPAQPGVAIQPLDRARGPDPSTLLRVILSLSMDELVERARWIASSPGFVGSSQ